MYFLLKTLITSLVVVGVSELARRSNLMAAALASLPLTTILAFLWIYVESGDTEKIRLLSLEVFWLVIPSLAFFLLLPWLLGLGLRFAFALPLACGGMAAGYGIFLWLRSAAGQ